MPGINGLETLRQPTMLNTNTPPVILYTAFADTQFHKEANALGAAAVVEKPAKVEFFLELIKELARAAILEG